MSDDVSEKFKRMIDSADEALVVDWALSTKERLDKHKKFIRWACKHSTEVQDFVVFLERYTQG